MNQRELLAIIASQLEEISTDYLKITPDAALTLIEVSEKLHRVQVLMQLSGTPDLMCVPEVRLPNAPTVETAKSIDSMVAHLRTIMGREPETEEVNACLAGNYPEYQAGEPADYTAPNLPMSTQRVTICGVKLGIDWVYKLPGGEWVDPACLRRRPQG